MPRGVSPIPECHKGIILVKMLPNDPENNKKSTPIFLTLDLCY